MINSVALVGRAGGDPSVRTFESGSKVAEINMALTRPGKDGKKETDWIQVKVWGKAAEVAEQYIKKGHLFGVTGELQQESWTKDGDKRSKIVVVARQLKLMQPKNEGNAQSEDTSDADIFGGYGD